MRAGRLRHRITIQKNKSTRDKFGGVINNWVLACIEPSGVMPDLT
ncbi:phage head completion protein [Xenorhabdus cabanillasii]|nr:hypothetical protein [Xenorhabdus sp. Flor]